MARWIASNVLIAFNVSFEHFFKQHFIKTSCFILFDWPSLQMMSSVLQIIDFVLSKVDGVIIDSDDPTGHPTQCISAQK